MIRRHHLGTRLGPEILLWFQVLLDADREAVYVSSFHYDVMEVYGD